MLDGSLVVNTPNISFYNEANILRTTTIIDVANSTFTNDGSMEKVEIVDVNGSRFINNRSADKVGEVTINTDQPITIGGDLRSIVIEKSTSLIVERGTINEIIADGNLEIDISILNDAQAQVNSKPQSITFKPISKRELDNVVNARSLLTEFELLANVDLKNPLNFEKAIMANQPTITAIANLPDGIEKRRLFDRYHNSYEKVRKSQVTPEAEMAVDNVIKDVNLTVSDSTEAHSTIRLTMPEITENGPEVNWGDYTDQEIKENVYITPDRPDKEGLVRTIILNVNVFKEYVYKQKLFAVKIPYGNDPITLEEVQSFAKRDYTSNSLFTFSGDYQIEFKKGATVNDLLSSGLLDKTAKVFSVPSNALINEKQLMNINTKNTSFLYSIVSDESLNEGQDNVEADADGLFKIDYEQKTIFYKGSVSGKTIRTYLNNSNPFDDQYLAIGFESVEPGGQLLVPTLSSPFMKVVVQDNNIVSYYSLHEALN